MLAYEPPIPVVIDSIAQKNWYVVHQLYGYKNLLPDKTPSVNPPAEYGISPAVNMEI